MSDDNVENNNNNENANNNIDNVANMSSVSSHESMPSLMSDDESNSGEDFDDGDDSSSDTVDDISDNNNVIQLVIQPPNNNNNNEINEPEEENLDDNDNDNDNNDNNNENEQQEQEQQEQEQQHRNYANPPYSVNDADEFWNNINVIINNENNQPVEEMDLAQVLNLLRSRMRNRHGNNSSFSNSINNNIDQPQRQRNQSLKDLINRLYGVIDEVNDLCWINYEHNSIDNIENKNNNNNDNDIDMKHSDEKTYDNGYGYYVYDKQYNLLNPSYNMTYQIDGVRNRFDVDAQNRYDSAQKRIPFKIPNNYPLINVTCEHDCILYGKQSEDNIENMNQEDMIPLQVAQWKMNLLAIDPIYKLIFIASGKHIYVYNLAITNKNVTENYKKPFYIITNITSSINRISYDIINGNEPVVYAVDYDGYINVIYCKYVKNMLSQDIIIDKISNIIPEKNDNSCWSIGVAKGHNRIVIGSNAHIIQVHDCTKDSTFQKLRLIGHMNNVPCVAYHPYNENKIASVSIDGTVRIWDINDRYNIKKKYIDFKDKLNTGNEHDIWLWSVCWINNPCLFINGNIIEKMKYIRDYIFEFYKQRKIWNDEIKSIKRVINRRHNDSNKEFIINSIHKCCDIIIYVKKQFEFVIGMSCLCENKKNELCNEFEQRLNVLMKEFQILKDECAENNEQEQEQEQEQIQQEQHEQIENESSVSTHESIANVLIEDEGDENIVNEDSVSTHASMPSIMSDDNDSNDNDNDIEMNEQDEIIFMSDDEQILDEGAMNVMHDFVDENEHKIGPQSVDVFQCTPPAAQQGFNEIINYGNNLNEKDVPVISPLSEQKGNDEMDINVGNDGWCFDVIVYNDNGKDEIQCDFKTIRMENVVVEEKKLVEDIDMNDNNNVHVLEEEDIIMVYEHGDVNRFVGMNLEGIKDVNAFNEMFILALNHFKPIRWCLILMEHEMKLNVDIVSKDESPFINLDFKTQTIKLSNELSEIRHELIILCRDLIRYKCINDLKINSQTQLIEPNEDNNNNNINVISKDKLKDIKIEIIQLMIIKLQNLYKLYINCGELYILWLKQYNDIEKRKSMIRHKNENDEIKNKSNKDYIVTCSRSNVYLINTENMKIVDCIENIMNNVLPGYSGCHRLEYCEYIEELSLLIVSSNACNRFAFIRICNKNHCESEPVMILEGFYPNNDVYKDNLGCILGIQAIKCGNKMWRLYVLYQISERRGRNSGVPVKLVSFLITCHKVCENDSFSFMQCIM